MAVIYTPRGTYTTGAEKISGAKPISQAPASIQAAAGVSPTQPPASPSDSGGTSRVLIGYTPAQGSFPAQPIYREVETRDIGRMSPAEARARYGERVAEALSRRDLLAASDKKGRFVATPERYQEHLEHSIPRDADFFAFTRGEGGKPIFMKYARDIALRRMALGEDIQYFSKGHRPTPEEIRQAVAEADRRGYSFVRFEREREKRPYLDIGPEFREKERGERVPLEGYRASWRVKEEKGGFQGHPNTKVFERETGIARINPYIPLTSEEQYILRGFRGASSMKGVGKEYLRRLEDKLAGYIRRDVQRHYPKMGYKVADNIARNEARVVTQGAKGMSQPVSETLAALGRLGGKGVMWQRYYGRPNYPFTKENVQRVSVHAAQELGRGGAYVLANPVKSSQRAWGAAGAWTRGGVESAKADPAHWAGRQIASLGMGFLVFGAAARVIRSPLGAPIRIPVGAAWRNIPKPKLGVLSMPGKQFYQRGGALYVGPTIETKWGNYPLLGRYRTAEGWRWVLGNPGKKASVSPELRKAIRAAGKEGFIPSGSTLEAAVYGQRRFLKQAAGRGLGVPALSRALERGKIISYVGRSAMTRHPGILRQWRTNYLKNESRVLSARELDTILGYARYLNSRGKLEAMYGSATAMPYIRKPLRGAWADVDIQLKVRGKELEDIAREYARRLGRDFRVRGSLVEKRMGKRWVHALDLHSADEAPYSWFAGRPGAWGLKYGQRKVRMAGLPTMSPEEFYLRTTTASQRIYPGRIGPAGWRWKDAYRSYAMGLSIFKPGSWEYRMISRWPRTFTEAEWHKALEAAGRYPAKIPVMFAQQAGGKLRRIPKDLIPLLPASTTVSVYRNGKIVSSKLGYVLKSRGIRSRPVLDYRRISKPSYAPSGKYPAPKSGRPSPQYARKYPSKPYHRYPSKPYKPKPPSQPSKKPSPRPSRGYGRPYPYRPYPPRPSKPYSPASKPYPSRPYKYRPREPYKTSMPKHLPLPRPKLPPGKYKKYPRHRRGFGYRYQPSVLGVAGGRRGWRGRGKKRYTETGIGIRYPRR